MRSKMRLLPLFVVCLITAGSALHAQNTTLEEYVRRKMRWSQEEVDRALRDRIIQGRRGKLLDESRSLAGAKREAVVSGDSEVESEVHAAINPTDSNNIIISPIYQGEIQQGLLCPVYYTKDFGATWRKSSFENIPASQGEQILTLGGGDPIVIFDYDGTAYLIWLAIFFKNFDASVLYSGMFWARSTDGGVTWTLPENDYVAVSGMATGSTGTLYDKEWAAVDGSSSQFRNSLYVAYMGASPTGDNVRIEVRRKRAGSLEFNQEPAVVTDNSFSFVQFTNVDTDADGRVHVTFFGRKGTSQYGLWHSVSSDGGVSFSTPNRISDAYPQGEAFDILDYDIPGITSSRLYPCPQFVVDKSSGPTRGNLYIAWTAAGISSNTNEGLDVYFSRSTDGGATWSPAKVVHDDPRGIVRHQFYPSITVNNAGVVAVTWYDRRNDPQHRATHYYMAQSFDGGVTFGQNFPVSTEPSNFAQIGTRNNGFGIGEYTQVLSTPGHAIAVWADGRGNDGDIDIYAAFVPLDPSVSSVTRAGTVSEKFRLFEPSTASPDRIAFRLEEASSVTLRLFDASGRLVATLAEGRFEPGTHTLPIADALLATGRYFCSLETSHGIATIAFSVVK